jgi:hypothetical protein
VTERTCTCSSPATTATESKSLRRQGTSGDAWANDISHGELIRASPVQTMTADPCNLHFLYQGRSLNSGGD